MYESFFQLERAPFTIAPDPHFLYMSERHREALAHLLWGLGSDGGFVLLTGEVGTGKTTLSRCLLEQIPDAVDVAFVVNPRVTATELLATLCDELRIPVPPEDRERTARLVDRINDHLLAAHGAGRRTVLVIDEAQNLDADVLEQLRLLTNLETNERKLLQIILIGQPELAEILRRPELRQLSQRITARYHLDPLSEAELTALVHHRLTVAGARRNPFEARALRALHHHCGGIPRLANVIADRALMGAYAGEQERIGADVVRRAAREVLGTTDRRHAGVDRRLLLGVAGGLAAGLLIAAAAFTLRPEPAGAPAVAPASAATTPEPGRDPAGTPDAGTPAAGTPDAAGTRGPSGSADAPPAPSAASTPPAPTPAAVDAEAAPVPSVPDRAEQAGPAAAGLAGLWALAPQESRRAAFEAVLERWFTPLALAADSVPCERVLAVGLRCLEHDGNWTALRTLDRPAVLELWPPDGGAPRAAALLSADDAGATLDIGGRETGIDRAALDARWRGRATVLWQMPPDWQGSLQRGDTGPAVAWLRAKLDEIDGRPPAAETAASRRFDAELEGRVRAFQRESGLRTDGIAGPRTWIRINGATAGAVPTLGDREGG